MTAADIREGTCPSGSGHPPGGIESYHRLVSMAGEPAAITNLEGTVLICNPKTASLLGFNNSAELIGRNALDFVAGEDRDRARAGIERILGEGEVRGKQLTLVRRDGGRVRVEVNLASIADEENVPLRLVSLVPSIANSLPDAEESQSSAADLESKLAECNAELERCRQS